jgi:hypothetical protein
MTTRLPLLLLFLSAFLIPLPGQDQAPPSDREAKAKESAELRLSYAASDAYSPYNSDVGDLRVQCIEQMDKKDYAKVIELAGRGLLKDQYNIQLLILQAAAYRATGEIEKAERARVQWFGLVDSILNSGDGRSFDTAFRVISVDEEYAVLMVLRLEPGSQKLVEHNGSEFDVLTVKDTRSGDGAELYFNIDLPKKWLNRQLAKKDSPPSPDQPPPPAPPVTTPPAAPTTTATPAPRQQ